MSSSSPSATAEMSSSHVLSARQASTTEAVEPPPPSSSFGLAAGAAASTAGVLGFTKEHAPVLPPPPPRGGHTPDTALFAKVLGGSLAFLWVGTGIRRVCNFLLQYLLLHFKSTKDEAAWHASTVRGKMAFVRLCCVAKVLLNLGLIALTVAWASSAAEESDTEVDGACIRTWVRISAGLGVAFDTVAFCVTYFPSVQTHWQWVSAGFIVAAVVAVQTYPLCHDCDTLIEAYTRNFDSDNGTHTFCFFYFGDSDNFTVEQCNGAERGVVACLQNSDAYRSLALVFAVYAAMYAPPLRVLCVGNVINLTLTMTFVFGSDANTAGAVCSGFECYGFALQLTMLYFIVHLMFWLIEVNSRAAWVVSRALALQNVHLDRLANPFSPDAFRIWLEDKRRRRRHRLRRRQHHNNTAARSVHQEARQPLAPGNGNGDGGFGGTGGDAESWEGNRSTSVSVAGAGPGPGSELAWDLDMANFVVEERPFAAGSSGQVFRATYKGQQVAIKELYALKRMANDASYSETGAELTVLSQLRHPNVLAWYGIVYMEAVDSVGIVTEFCSGGSLEQWLGSSACQAASDAEILRKALQIAAGMRYLHEDVRLVHRDLKPANVLLVSDGGVCKIGDFGLSGANQAAAGGDSVAGTPEYMSPELFDEHAVDFTKVDVYAYAVVLWQLLSRGGVPFEDTTRGGFREVREAVGRRGERPDVQSVVVPDANTAVRSRLQQLLRDAWLQQPAGRPSFVMIVDVLAPIAAVLQMRGDMA